MTLNKKVIYEITEQATQEWSDKFFETMSNIVDYFCNLEEDPDKRTTYRYGAMSYLYTNPNVTWKTIQKRNCYKIFHHYLHANPNVTKEVIESNLDVNWNFYYICYMQDKISLEFIDANPKIQWCWAYISRRSDLTWEFLSKHLDEKLDWFYLSKNVSWNIIKDHPELPWNYKQVCSNKTVTWKIITENQDKLKNYFEISRNNNVTWKDVSESIKNGQTKWDFTQLSQNSGITIDDINDNPEFPWDYELVSLRPDITLNDVKTKLKGKWDWSSLIYRENCPVDIIMESIREKHPVDESIVGLLLKNKGVSIQTAENIIKMINPSNRKYGVELLSLNENLPLDYVMNNLDKKWSITDLCENNFSRARESFIEEYIYNAFLAIHKTKYVKVLNEIKYVVFMAPDNLEYSELLGLELEIPTDNEWKAKLVN